ncbi:hypothetical protein CPB86DRAFT_685753, partial [Serendipita vermifera]
DSGVGKTSLLIRINKNDFPKYYVPITYEPFVRTFQTQESGEFELHCYEKQPPDCEVGNRLDALEYHDADLIMMCFAFDNPDSLDNLTEK